MHRRIDYQVPASADDGVHYSDHRQGTGAEADAARRRCIKRFVHALAEGVPRDHPANLAAADWIRQCRRAGLYAYGRALYEQGGFDFGSLAEDAQAAVEEDYQICVRRS